MILRSQLKTVGNGIFGIAGGDKIVPLQARMQPHALVYFEDPYFVCRVRAGGPDEQWCSVLTLENTFPFGAYKWQAKASNPGAYRHHWLGGFERHHGFATEGIIGFYIFQGAYEVWTYWDGVGEATVLENQDWTTEKTFKVVWTPSKVEYYVDNMLIETHLNIIPKGPMNFFFEAGRRDGITTIDHAVFFKKDSFIKLE